MLGEIDKQMMLKFLERNYPVSRIKHNMRFKRGIILDDGTSYLLSGGGAQHLALQYKLFEIIIKIFDCDEATSRAVLSNFLKLE